MLVQLYNARSEQRGYARIKNHSLNHAFLNVEKLLKKGILKGTFLQ